MDINYQIDTEKSICGDFHLVGRFSLQVQITANTCGGFHHKVKITTYGFLSVEAVRLENGSEVQIIFERPRTKDKVGWYPLSLGLGLLSVYLSPVAEGRRAY